MLDGILLEKYGIPAVSIVTDCFIETGQAMAEAWGLAHYKFLTVPHPIANLTNEELDRRAQEIVPEVIRLFLTGQGKG